MTCLRWGRALALCIFVAAPATAQEQSVRDRVVTVVRAKLPTAILTPTDPSGFTLKMPDREEENVSVQRIADFCAANGAAACDEQIVTFAAAVVDFATTDFTVTRARLRVIVRNKLDTDGYLATIPQPAKRPLVRPLFGDVSAVLAADFPKGTRMVNEEDLATLQLTADQAFALGVDQSLGELPKVPAAADIAGKIVMINGYAYGASVMLRPDRWRVLNDATGGTLFVAIPSDDEVVIGTARSDADLAKLRELIGRDYSQAARGISPTLYRWSPSGWVAVKQAGN